MSPKYRYKYLCDKLIGKSECHTDISCRFTRLIQEEKETTEQRAEELESRVGSHTNLEAMSAGRGWQRDRSFERSSPPVSGRSTPTPRGYATAPRDFLHKYHTVSDNVS